MTLNPARRDRRIYRELPNADGVLEDVDALSVDMPTWIAEALEGCNPLLAAQRNQG